MPAVVLKAVLQDPLLHVGGLRRVSELGRLLLEPVGAAPDLADQLDPNPGEEPLFDWDGALQGDSDDGEFGLEQVAQVDDHSSDEDDPMDLAHGIGLHMGAHLAHVPVHELLGGHIGGIDDDLEAYPLMHD